MKNLVRKIKARKQKRQEHNEAIVRDFIQAIIHRARMMQDENILQYPPPTPVEQAPKLIEPEKTQTPVHIWKKPAFKWLLSAVACVLSAILLTFAFGGFCIGGRSGGTGGGSGNSPGAKLYNAENAKKLGQEEGVFFEDLYDQMLADEGILMFTQIIPGTYAYKEVYDDETEELLGYVLQEFIADASDSLGCVVFTIDFRVCFVSQYEFDGYQLFYESLEESFQICGTEFKWQFKDAAGGTVSENSKVFVSFSFGGLNYFLEIKTFELTDSGILTELNEQNIIRLMRNLMSCCAQEL